MCKVYGYCRISTRKQDIERQVRNILDYCPSAIICKEAFTGTKLQGRKELEKIVKRVQQGDTIVFDAVDRMSRNAAEGIALYDELMERGVELVFLKQHHIDTATYKAAATGAVSMTGDTVVDAILEGVNKALAILRHRQIEQAFEAAQGQVVDLHRRTSEGIETARLNGKQIGQKAGNKLTIKKEAPAKDAIMKYSKDFNGTLSDSEVMKLAGICRNTYYKYKKELAENA